MDEVVTELLIEHKTFLKKRLGDLSTLPEIYTFSYDNILRNAKTVDAVWFNNRRMPNALFEVEYTTNFQNSLLKFTELQDLNSGMYIVSDEKRKKEFERKMELDAFSVIRDRVSFMDYDKLSMWHAKMHELYEIIS